MIYLIIFPWATEMREDEAVLAVVLREQPSCKVQNQHSWHLAFRKPVSQAGLWSIISLSRLAIVQPGRRAGCIHRNQSQLAGSGTAELPSLHWEDGRLINTCPPGTQRGHLPAWH